MPALYDNLTISELRKQFFYRELKLDRSSTKAELVAVLEQDDAEREKLKALREPQEQVTLSAKEGDSYRFGQQTKDAVEILDQDGHKVVTFARCGTPLRRGKPDEVVLPYDKYAAVAQQALCKHG